MTRSSARRWSATWNGAPGWPCTTPSPAPTSCSRPRSRAGAGARPRRTSRSGASAVIRPGCGGIAVRGEQVEERADPKSLLGGVAEQVAAIHGIPGAAADPGAGEVARGLQVGHDDLDGALGEADDGADVADPGSGIAGDLHQHVPVPGQQRPTAAALVRN